MSFWERESTLRSSIQKRGLTTRSEVTGSGVVVDVGLIVGATRVGTEPVLRAAESLKNKNFFPINEVNKIEITVKIRYSKGYNEFNID